MNVYKQILAANLNKLLSLYDTDTVSDTYGYGDREYWGWKTKDFSNATFQGGVHSLAIAIKLDLFKPDQHNYVMGVIHSAILAIKYIQDKNGSVVEAYPRENSFCVTALVAFDVLSAIQHLGHLITEDQRISYFSVIRPLIEFITKNGEEHSIISNHLATGVAAITLWNHLTNASNPRDQQLLQLIYDNQSYEGWYKEYEGADPGYQTLCTYYLYCAYEISSDQTLLESLKRSNIYLNHFVHPDGTIGGLYGSRNTEVYYPGGIIGLADTIKECAGISRDLAPANQHVLPQNIDIGNFIPLLNSYAVAARTYEGTSEAIENCATLALFNKNGNINFPDAGIFIASTEYYFALLNYKKGGTMKVFNKKSKSIDLEDGGLFGELNSGAKISTQYYDSHQRFDDYTIVCKLYKINQSRPNPLNFIILRALGLTVFRFISLGNIFKKFIVHMLMTGKKAIHGTVVRKFEFSNDSIVVYETVSQHLKKNNLKHTGKSKSIHMASSGYYLTQNVNNSKSELVKFIND